MLCFSSSFLFKFDIEFSSRIQPVQFRRVSSPKIRSLFVYSFPTLEARLVIILTFVKVIIETQCFRLLQPSNKILFYILYVYSIFKVNWYQDDISSRWAFGANVRAPRAVLPSLSMLNTFAYTRQLLAIVTYMHLSGCFNLHQA